MRKKQSYFIKGQTTKMKYLTDHSTAKSGTEGSDTWAGVIPDSNWTFVTVALYCYMMNEQTNMRQLQDFL